ncbi:MAG: membrane protein of unknown function [Candidatus Thorarchaeota archaeon]|nr:MAG: membrane protein of unknown function [Candidatus Thorarchaeota archaeon]
MNKETEEQCYPILLDKTETHRQILKYLFVGSILFVGYLFVLYLLCNDDIPILLIRLFLQVAVGMAAIRVAFSLGMKTRESVKVFSPNKKVSDWETHHFETGPERLNKIFEQAIGKIGDDLETNYDDWIDLAWFAVMIWAMIEILIFILFDPIESVCAFSSILLSILCVGVFTNGYRSADIGYILDNLNHLEYLLQARMRIFSSLVTSQSFEAIFLLKKKGKKCVIYDLRVDILRNKENNTVIRYYLGLPRQEQERIHIRSIGPLSKDDLANIDISEEENWSLRMDQSGDYFDVYFINIDESLDLSNSSTYVKSPDDINQHNLVLTRLLEYILEKIQ